MRVLHVISGIDRKLGGPTAALIGLVRAQANVGIKPALLSTYRSGEQLSVIEELNDSNIPARAVGPGTGALVRHPQTIKTLREEIVTASIVHIHAVWEDVQYQAARVAFEKKVPYVMTPHGMLDEWSMSHSAFKKKLYLRFRLRKYLNRAAALHFTTQPEMASVRRLKLRPAHFVEPIGIDLHEFENPIQPGSFTARFPELGDSPYILFLGRIQRGKGLELLVPAMRKLTDKNVRLVVVGPDEGGYRATIEGLIDQANVRDRIIFTGMLKGTEKLQALRDAYLLCLPSFHENFGIAAAEALASGTPVIVSDQVNIHPEIAAAGVGGVVPTDADALASEIDQWLANPACREMAASRCRAFVAENYNWDTIARHWIDHYQRIISNQTHTSKV